MVENKGRKPDKQNEKVSRDQEHPDKNEQRTGQETLGKRGQKLDKKDKEHYQRDQTGKAGTHGGNR